MSTIAVGAVNAIFRGDPAEQAIVARALSAFDKSVVHTWQYRTKQTDGVARFMHRVSGSFPSGLTWRARNALIQAGYPAPQINWGPTPAVMEPLYDEPVAEIRDYQERAVNTAIKVRRVLLKCATGGGKTLTAMEIIRQLGRPTLWLTHRRELADQTMKVAAEALGRKTAKQYVHVEMVQTLSNKIANEDVETIERLANYEVVVLDEAHRAGAAQWLAIANRCHRAIYRIGLSATPETGNDATDMRIEGVIGPTYIVAGASELAARGYLAKPRMILLRPPKTSYPRYENVRDIVCPNWRDDPKQLQRLGHTMFKETYDRGVIENTSRNDLIVETTLRRMQAGERVLVLVNRVAHAVELAEIIGKRLVSDGVYGAGFVFQLDGGSSDEDRREQLDSFKEARGSACLVATPFFKEGIDVPQIDTGILAGGGLSDVPVLQGLGRMLRPRPDKPTVDIYEIFDDDGTHTSRDEVRDNYLRRHSMARLRLYREQGFEIVEKE